MYPYIRMLSEVIKVRNKPRSGFFDVYENRVRVWPQDIDPWMELNNGRTLTLFDLGRIPFALSCGAARVMSHNGWGLTVAGNSTRYRRRVKLWDLLTIKTRFLGWDERFLYIHQAMWKKDECTSHMLLRSAIVNARRGRSGIVEPAIFAQAMGVTQPSPPLPNWVLAWSKAETERPWPPLF